MDVKKWVARLAIAFAATGCNTAGNEKQEAEINRLEAQIGNERDVFYNSLNNNDDMRSLTRRYVYGEMFENSALVTEGTVEQLLHEKGGDPAVDRLKKDVVRHTQGVMQGLRADALTADFIPRVYDYALGRSFRAMPGGLDALDAVGEKRAAAALAGTLYVFGDRKGTEILTKAVNKVGAQKVKQQERDAARLRAQGKKAQDPAPFAPVENAGALAPPLFAAYGALARDPAAHASLLETVKKESDAAARAARLKANFADQIPEYRRDSLTYRDDGVSWASFLKALDRKDRPRSELHKFVYKNVFVGEGGHQLARTSSAVGGIMNDTIEKLLNDKSDNSFVRDLKREVKELSGGHGADALTSGLSSDVLPDLYDYDLMYRFRALKDAQGKQMSPAAVLGEIGEKHAAAALVDTLFRFGDKGGATIIAHAVNEVNRGKPGYKPVNNPDLFGPQLFASYKELARDPGKLQPLLDGIAKQRGYAVAAQAKREKFKKYEDSLKAGEARRSEAFRFLDRAGTEQQRIAGEQKPGGPSGPG